MRKLLASLVILTSFMGCKTEKKEVAEVKDPPQLTP
jgi:hypothetical protein